MKIAIALIFVLAFVCYAALAVSVTVRCRVYRLSFTIATFSDLKWFIMKLFSTTLCHRITQWTIIIQSVLLCIIIVLNVR